MANAITEFALVELHTQQTVHIFWWYFYPHPEHMLLFLPIFPNPVLYFFKDTFSMYSVILKLHGRKQEKEWSIEWHLQITFSLWFWKEGLCEVLIAELLSKGRVLKMADQSFWRICVSVCWESVLSKGNLWQVLIWRRKKRKFLRQVITGKKKGKREKNYSMF